MFWKSLYAVLAGAVIAAWLGGFALS